MSDQDKIIALVRAILTEAEQKELPHIAALARSALVLLQPPPTLGISVSDEAATADQVKP